MDITQLSEHQILEQIGNFSKDGRTAEAIILFMMCHGKLDGKVNHARPAGLNVQKIVTKFCCHENQRKVLC